MSTKINEMSTDMTVPLKMIITNTYQKCIVIYKYTKQFVPFTIKNNYVK